MRIGGKESLSTSAQGALVAAIVAVIIATVGVIVYTNKTLHSIENNLPSTLLTEMKSLNAALDSLHDVAASARIASATGDKSQLSKLKAEVQTLHRLIVDLRNTYVRDNLVHASSFHAAVAPAIADIQIWLTEGISGWAPDSKVTLTIIEERMNKTLVKAARFKSDAHNAAEAILDIQRKRLERFQQSVNALFTFTIFLIFFLILMLLRQREATMRVSEAKAELQQQLDLLDNLLHSLPQGIAVWNQDLHIIRLNAGFTAITGYDEIDLPHMHHWPLLAYPDPEYRRSVIDHWHANSADGSACEYMVTCKNGEVKDIEFRAVHLADARIITTLNDVTERNLREKLIQESQRREARAKKMESLGLLAGGVAHDLNNILTGIVSYPDLVLLELEPDDRLRKPIELMRESGQRASAIVQDLLTVAQGVAVEKQPLGLNEIIEDYLQSADFQAIQRNHPLIEIECMLADNLVNVIGSRVHLRKILMNLIRNGCEAMDGSGIVSITTANHAVFDEPRTTSDLAIGQHAVLTVSDQGKGISAADREKIFEPFYSKKILGESGTGLGLTVVWNVVQDHEGHIEVSSSNQGTTFTVYLPGTGQQTREPLASFDLASFRGNGELILVVDDVASQRQITCSILDKLGYRAESVCSGEDAVEFIRQQSVDLVILDMIMTPGINGRQTYERILEFAPGQKALIVSGYAETENVRQTLLLGAGAFLKKPLLIKDLAATLKKLLTASVARPNK